MPKVREKKSGNINKSGVLTQNFRKELLTNSHMNNFVLKDVFHNEEENDLDIIQFNDNNTIIFNSKTVNATLGIEKKYVSSNSYLNKNKVLNTPNSLDQDSTYEVQKIVNPEDYSHVLYSNYISELNSDRNKPYNDSFVDYEVVHSDDKAELVDKATSYENIIYNFKNKRYEISNNFEEININFNKSVTTLSFNLNNNVVDYDNSEPVKNIPYVKFHDNQCFLAQNNNTIYLDDNSSNDQETYYTLGNSKANYFSDITSFSAAAITNNPLTIYDDDVMGSSLNGQKVFTDTSSISNPISDFGYPFSKRFRGTSEVEVDLSKHISEDFILEKIYISFRLKNYAISTNTDKPCFNTLNFFVLNQRGNVDINNKQYQNIFTSDNEDFYYADYWDGDSLEESQFAVSPDNALYSRAHVITRTKFVGVLEEGAQIDEFDGRINTGRIGLEKNGVYTNQALTFNDHKQREVITNIKIANVGRAIEFGNKTQMFESLKDADAIVFSDEIKDESLNSTGVVVTDYILNDEWKDINILSPVRSFKKNEYSKRFSKFEIYPKQRSERTGIPIKAERSVNSEGGVISENNYGVGNRNRTIDENGNKFDYGGPTNSSDINKNFLENPYIVRPKDKLIFGFNFCPSMSIQEEVHPDELIYDMRNQYRDLNGRDVIMLDLRNLKIKLLGRYVVEDKAFNPKKSEFENKNIKKINELSTNVVDKLGLPTQYMLRGAYYNSFTSDETQYPNVVSLGKNTFSGFNRIPQASTGSISFGLSTMNSDMYEKSSVTNYLRGNVTHTDSDRHLSYSFKTDHFGFYSDKLDDNKHYSYTNTVSGKTTFNVEKYFRKDGYYIQKNESSGDEINSYNKDKHARLLNTQEQAGELDPLLTAYTENT
jgi:hypothetical protein